MRKNSTQISGGITMTHKTTVSRKLRCRIAGSLLAALMAVSTLTYAQTAAVSSVVPNIVNYNGTLTDGGKPLNVISGVTFPSRHEEDAGANEGRNGQVGALAHEGFTEIGRSLVIHGNPATTRFPCSGRPGKASRCCANLRTPE
jgi:hypothetical protein